MGRWKIVALGVSAVCALGWLAFWYSERIDMVFLADGIVYTNIEACWKNADRIGDGPSSIRVPSGTVMLVTYTDYSSKNWPCYEAQYQGRSVFFTHSFVAERGAEVSERRRAALPQLPPRPR